MSAFECLPLFVTKNLKPRRLLSRQQAAVCRVTGRAGGMTQSSVRRAALFNEINHGLGIQWNVTAASNYWWRGHEKYIRVLLAIMALCLKAVGATTSTMKRWASDGALDAAMV